MDSEIGVEDLVFSRGEWPKRPTSSARVCAPRPTSCLCANCDTVFAPPAQLTPYCGQRCRSEADAVRYGRGLHIEYGNSPPHDKAQALRIRIAHALAGGYRTRARKVSPERRAEVIARDGGLCVLCGADGEEIDHIDGDSDELSNLRYLCKPCHREITEKHLVPVTAEETKRRVLVLHLRIASLEPLRPCDRADWERIWRTWTQEHSNFGVIKPSRPTASSVADPSEHEVSTT